ncbi:hypothetical protein HJG60_011799 [Phyllostomus discolor]|uniref:Uncharacterized protein n=1 Tax=Phyllostomus discolor TaxID=89673 RepID=A0A833ZIZ8_9CHIR|nr:hypothetical protein HJG60_011799 [Phyllostomus discolor]
MSPLPRSGDEGTKSPVRRERPMEQPSLGLALLRRVDQEIGAWSRDREESGGGTGGGGVVTQIQGERESVNAPADAPPPTWVAQPCSDHHGLGWAVRHPRVLVPDVLRDRTSDCPLSLPLKQRRWLPFPTPGSGGRVRERACPPPSPESCCLVLQAGRG